MENSNFETEGLTDLQARLLQARIFALAPPERLTLVEWADKYRMLSREASSEPGHWKTSRVAVARGAMEAYSDPDTHIITVMCCTQLMKTELGLNIVGYHIACDPCPMIFMEPTVEICDAVSKDRIDTMIRDTPEIKARVPDAKSRDGGNTLRHKSFAGGHITLIGSNAPGNLSSRPVRVVICDEIDKYPPSAGEEGDPVKLLAERSATFWNYKIVHLCSPTVEGRSRIAQEYEAGDKRVFEVDCPYCGHRGEMKWGDVHWKEDKPETAVYVCPECGTPWTERDRYKAIGKAAERPPEFDSAGRFSGYGWRAMKPFKGHASFRASKLCSPWETLGKIAEKFCEAKGNQEKLKTFINTQLAETFRERGDAPKWELLFNRRENYPRNLIPERAGILTAGVDVQKNRLECEIVAWGIGCESWSIDYRVFPGDTATLTSECWNELRKMLTEEWKTEGGGKMRLDRMGIDSGYNTQQVYNFWRGLGENRTRCMITKGQHNAPVIISIPTAREVTTQRKRDQRGVQLWHIGTNICKTELYGFLRIARALDAAPDEYPAGWCHFPKDYPDEYFRMLTAEEVRASVSRGVTYYVWEKIRERNEALDCRVIARAVASAFGLDRWTPSRWAERAEVIGAKPPEIIVKKDEKKSKINENNQRNESFVDFWSGDRGVY